MTQAQHLAKHFRSIHFGGNWSASNLKDQLADVTWQQAIKKPYDTNSILALTYHMNYYVAGVLKVLKGGSLDIRDKFSFDHPSISSEVSWNAIVDKSLTDAELFATEVDKMPDERIWDVFTNEKYGNYYSNIHGLIEHNHYHLGQIVIIKKIILGQNCT